MEVVAGTIQRPFDYRRQGMAHKDRAQMRLFYYREKQINRTLKQNSRVRAVKPEVITDLQAQDIGMIEHKFFPAKGDSEEQIKAKQRKRRMIGSFVRKGRW